MVYTLLGGPSHSVVYTLLVGLCHDAVSPIVPISIMVTLRARRSSSRSRSPPRPPPRAAASGLPAAPEPEPGFARVEAAAGVAALRAQGANSLPPRFVSTLMSDMGLEITAAPGAPVPESLQVDLPECGLVFHFMQRRGTNTWMMTVTRHTMSTVDVAPHGSCFPKMPMHVIVHTQGRMFTLVVEASDTIGKVKRQIQDEQGIPHDRQRLFYFGYSTKDDLVLSTYNIQTGSSLILEDSSACYPLDPDDLDSV